MSETREPAEYPLHRRVRAVRERANVSTKDAALALGISPLVYSRIEDGSRNIKGDELIRLADTFGVRAGAITGLAEVTVPTTLSACPEGDEPGMPALRDYLRAYCELDAFLTEQGFPAS
jgi:transcriptional regulator with XRE-family HTH domain